MTLANVPLHYRYGGGATIAVELPEAEALPYEVIDEDARYRTFMMPAAVANKFPRRLE